MIFDIEHYVPACGLCGGDQIILGELAGMRAHLCKHCGNESQVMLFKSYDRVSCIDIDHTVLKTQLETLPYVSSVEVSKGSPDSTPVLIVYMLSANYEPVTDFLTEDVFAFAGDDAEVIFKKEKEPDTYGLDGLCQTDQ